MRVRPDAFHQLVLANKFPRSFHKRDQRVERPASETKRLIAFQQHALARKKPKGAKDDSLLRGRQSTYPRSSHLRCVPFCNRLTRSVGKIDQDIQHPTAEE